RVDERLDQLQEFGDRARKAVRDQERLRVAQFRPDVQEMDVLTVDLGGELRVLVERRLLGAPVESRAPVLGKLLEMIHRYAPGPSNTGQLGGPAGLGEPVVQIVQVRLGNRYAERVHHVLLVNGA